MKFDNIIVFGRDYVFLSGVTVTIYKTDLKQKTICIGVYTIRGIKIKIDKLTKS